MATGISSVRRGYVLFILMLVYGFNFLDRQILVILQEPIKAEMGLSDGQLGLLTGFSFAVFYIAAGIPIAWMADRRNRRNIIATALVFWSTMTALCGLVQSYTHLVLLRIGVGAGEAGSTPPSHSMISDYFPKEKRATAFAIYTIGLYFGVAAGYGLGGIIGETIGWRYAFVLAGLPGILLAVILWTTVKEPVRGQWDKEKITHLTLKETIAFLSKRPAFWLVAFATAAGTFVNYGTGNFNPSYLIRAHGLSLGEAGIALAFVASLSGIAGTYLGGVLADRLGKRDQRWYPGICIIGQLLAVPFSFVAYLSSNLQLALAGMFLSHMFLVFMLAPSIAICHSLVQPAMRALASSILFFVVNLVGLGFGPLFVGFLSDFLSGSFGIESIRYAQVTACLVSLLSAGLFWLAMKKTGEQTMDKY